jgi:hypothetical protein
MTDITPRKSLNKRQTQLRQLLTDPEQYDQAIELFMSHHAMLHTQRMAGTESWSFEDEIIDDMTEAQIRRVPEKCEHSVVWCLWHIARCEDITMNLLVAGNEQVLLRDNWLQSLKTTIAHSGNAMNVQAIVEFSQAVDPQSLREYRVAVGRRTQEIVGQLAPDDMKQKVDPDRLQRVRDQGAVVEEASGIIEYWGGRDVAGLLLMPATRHNLVHLNQALKLKKRRQ